MITNKAKDILVHYNGELMFDGALMELINKVIDEVNNNSNLRVTHVKHWLDKRPDHHYIELILDEKENEND